MVSKVWLIVVYASHSVPLIHLIVEWGQSYSKFHSP